jgi:CheY-like chemotaxis protein
MNTTHKLHIKKLIIADDDHDDQILLRETLDDYEYPPEIEMVSDGCQLIEALQKNPLPDLVLLDLNMPNKSGIECLLELRSSSRYDKLPIVVLSTSKDPHDIEACFNSGANLFFSKPYTFKELKSLMHSVLTANWPLFLNQRLSKEEFMLLAVKGELPALITNH